MVQIRSFHTLPRSLKKNIKIDLQILCSYTVHCWCINRPIGILPSIVQLKCRPILFVRLRLCNITYILAKHAFVTWWHFTPSSQWQWPRRFPLFGCFLLSVSTISAYPTFKMRESTLDPMVSIHLGSRSLWGSALPWRVYLPRVLEDR